MPRAAKKLEPALAVIIIRIISADIALMRAQKPESFRNKVKKLKSQSKAQISKFITVNTNG